MTQLELYFATNRKHKGKNRWAPKGYGKDFSSDGRENLRFGKLTITADQNKIDQHLKHKTKIGVGNGESLAEYFTKQMKTAQIEAFEEKLDDALPDTQQPDAQLGSSRSFDELRENMKASRDVVIYVHGFNVSWEDAVASALSLETMLNRTGDGKVMVVLFTWPSDGMALPLVSYKSDRGDAQESGKAFGRGLLKLRDFLATLHKDDACKRELHLLCHSMGNYVLQHALARIIKFQAGNALPRIFKHIFMCAPDVNDNVFEPNKPLEHLHGLTRNVSVYHNHGDVAMYISDYTKSNPERLGFSGAAKPALLHNKVHQIDCTRVVGGMVEHSYYLSGRVNDDIRYSIHGKTQDDDARERERINNAWPNGWRMR